MNYETRKLRDEMAEKIGTEYTKLVNSHGSVEKNLDFNAAKWGAEKGFDAGYSIVKSEQDGALRVATEALEYFKGSEFNFKANDALAEIRKIQEQQNE